MYDEYTAYYSNACANPGDGRAAEDCACGGRGWILLECDAFIECPDHYDGQPGEECMDMDEAEYNAAWAAYEAKKALRVQPAQSGV